MTTYEFNNGMKVAWEPMTRENHKRFKERDRLEEIAEGMTRDNVQAYIKQYSAPRVVRVLAATIKANPHDYSKAAWLTARKVPPLCSGWDAEKFFAHSAIHRIYLEEIFMTLAKRYGEAVENEILF